MMPGRAKSPCGQRKNAGVAAIEFVIVLPVLLLLFFGMINLSNYISTLRKLNSATELVTDLASRHIGTIKSSDIDDYFNAAALLLLPASAEDLQVQLYNYRLEDGAAELKWQKSRTSGLCSPPDVSDPEIVALLANSDVLIAVACIPGYMAPAQFPGLPSFAEPRSSFALKPRHTSELNLD